MPKADKVAKVTRSNAADGWRASRFFSWESRCTFSPHENWNTGDENLGVYSSYPKLSWEIFRWCFSFLGELCGRCWLKWDALPGLGFGEVFLRLRTVLHSWILPFGNPLSLQVRWKHMKTDSKPPPVNRSCLNFKPAIARFPFTMAWKDVKFQCVHEMMVQSQSSKITKDHGQCSWNHPKMILLQE